MMRDLFEPCLNSIKFSLALVIKYSVNSTTNRPLFGGPPGPPCGGPPPLLNGGPCCCDTGAPPWCGAEGALRGGMLGGPPGGPPCGPGPPWPGPPRPPRPIIDKITLLYDYLMKLKLAYYYGAITTKIHSVTWIQHLGCIWATGKAVSVTVLMIDCGKICIGFEYHYHILSFIYFKF